MKNKKHYVINGERILAVISSAFVTAFLWFLAIFSEYEEDKVFYVISWCLAVLGVAALIGCFLFMPHHYTFDADGLRVVYFFGKYQYIKWVNVRKVEIYYDVSHGRGSATLDLFKMMFFVYRKYEIIGRSEDNFKRPHEFIISKSFRTTKYINLYWNGIVKEGIKAKKTKKRITRQNWIQKLFVRLKRNQ